MTSEYGELLVRLQEDDLLALGQVLQALLDLRHQVGRLLELDAVQEASCVSFLMATVIVFCSSLRSLVLPASGQLHVHALLQHGGDDHEDDEQDDHDVGHRA